VPPWSYTKHIPFDTALGLLHSKKKKKRLRAGRPSSDSLTWDSKIRTSTARFYTFPSYNAFSSTWRRSKMFLKHSYLWWYTVHFGKPDHKSITTDPKQWASDGPLGGALLWCPLATKGPWKSIHIASRTSQIVLNRISFITCSMSRHVSKMYSGVAR
jgi:hypothetical protein